VTFRVKFYLPPAISIQIQNGVTGDYAKITAKSTTGFTVELRNASNALITGANSRLIDWQAQGYGFIMGAFLGWETLQWLLHGSSTLSSMVT
jgi:hypothetical protein